MTVRVAIDLALDRLFTYEVPPVLQEKLAIGQLLSVPFGHRTAQGFAIDTSIEDTPPTDYVLKPILEIVDEMPFFTAALLELVRRMAVYYAAPIETVLKTALPAVVLKRTVHPREMIFVEPALTPLEVTLTRRQQWLYEQVVRLGGGWMMQLCRELSTTPAALRTLGEKGVVNVSVKMRRRDPLGSKRILPTSPLALNPEQATALASIANLPSPGTLLLHGITGSGKTEVYLQAIAAELAHDRGAIVLVPEISLTPQTVRRFASRFGNRVAVLHSALSDGERYDEWHRIRSGEARVVVGPRSAVFAPVRNLGLIVVDEEHETSYKQNETPRYHARDVAVLRGAIEGAKVVLGSATPSLESWKNAKVGKYRYVAMNRRAGSGSVPVVHLVNMTEEKAPSIFSQELLTAIGDRVRLGEQTILFLNRRGYSRSLVCEECGHVMTCPRCDLAYTYHRADECLRCHVCGGWMEMPPQCPACHAKALSYVGIGTQRVEKSLEKCFPSAHILRMDADSTSRKNSHDDILSAFGRGEADILIGTQMIAKGLDFPKVTLVGVLNADSSLNMPDFRAAERTYQLLAQVAGRAGRAELAGEVFIQSRDPTAAAIRLAAKGDFAEFAEEELASRSEWNYPPSCHLALATFVSADMKSVGDWATMYAKSLTAWAKANPSAKLVVGESLPSVLEKADGKYRWQIVLRAPSAASVVRAWRWIAAARPAPSSVRISLDVDAYDLV